MNRTLTLCLLLSIVAHLLLSVSFVHLPEEQVLVSVELKEGAAAPKAAPARPRTSANARAPTPSRSEESSPEETHAESAPVLGSALGLSTNYPKLSRILREEGEVVIRLSDLVILQSSGHSRLDASAQASVREGLNKGLLKPGDTQIRFIFKLRGPLDR